MKRLHLVDVSSMFFRAYYAIRPLSAPDGTPVNAIYGFLSMLTKLIKDERPEHLIFCYDRKEPSFRKDMYVEYKANRTEMPEDLAQQIPYIKTLADLLGVPSLEVPTFEADDLIGTMTKLGRKSDYDVVIVSGDKDFAQLIEPGVVLYDTMKDIKYDEAGAKEKWGISPSQMIDYLALVGDSSDNIPGVTGIGPKGACKLLEQYKDLEEIYANVDKVEPKGVREKLKASHDMAFLSKKLVTIVTDVPVLADIEGYRFRDMDRDGLRELLQKLNFKAFEKSLLSGGARLNETAAGSAATAMPAAPKAPATTIVKPAGVEAAMWPIETPAVEAWIESVADGSEIWGLAAGDGAFFFDGARIISPDGDLKLIGPVADRKKIRWLGFDLKTLWHRTNAETPVGIWDAMLAAYAVEAGDRSDAAKVMTEHLGEAPDEISGAGAWIHAHLQLRLALEQKMNERGVQKIYAEEELPLASILLRMEKRGIRIDKPLLAEQSQSLEQDLKVVEAEVHELAGEPFNIGSPKQLGQILFEKLKIPAGRKTKTGYSTDNGVLEKVDHPIAAKVLYWRELAKLKSTYVDALPVLADADDRIHTSFDQALTATGRLSSTAPNLQNIPIRTPRGQEVRRAFIAAPGKMLLSVDYSQIELRILAHISKDPGLVQAFENDLDIHAATAAEVFGVSLKDVTGEQRRAAKAVNFGIAYGQGAFGLAENLGIPRGEAQVIIQRYFEKFKGVQDYIESTTKMAHEQGYVETLFGRRRYIVELQSKNPAMRKFGERAAINAPIQGTASDLVKKAMINLLPVKVDLLLQVHDELIFEGTEDELRSQADRIVSIMENVAQLNVPLKANHAIGLNWDEAH